MKYRLYNLAVTFAVVLTAIGVRRHQRREVELAADAVRQRPTPRGQHAHRAQVELDAVAG